MSTSLSSSCCNYFKNTPTIYQMWKVVRSNLFLMEIFENTMKRNEFIEVDQYFNFDAKIIFGQLFPDNITIIQFINLSQV